MDGPFTQLFPLVKKYWPKKSWHTGSWFIRYWNSK